jgi:hypothetical protein
LPHLPEDVQEQVLGMIHAKNRSENINDSCKPMELIIQKAGNQVKINV